MEVKIEGFDWDSGNSFKSGMKHGISWEAIEEFFHGRIFVAPDLKHSTTEERHLAIGRGPGRKPMIVAFTIRETKGLKLIRAISARFMHTKEAKKYEEAFTQNEE